MSDYTTSLHPPEQSEPKSDLVEVSKRGLILGGLFLAIVFMFIGIVLKVILDRELTNFIVIVFTVTTLGTAWLYLNDDRKRDKLFKKLYEK